MGTFEARVVPLLELIAVVAAIVASSAAGGLAHAARIAIELERDRNP